MGDLSVFDLLGVARIVHRDAVPLASNILILNLGDGMVVRVNHSLRVGLVIEHLNAGGLELVDRIVSVSVVVVHGYGDDRSGCLVNIALVDH